MRRCARRRCARCGATSAPSAKLVGHPASLRGRRAGRHAVARRTDLLSIARSDDPAMWSGAVRRRLREQKFDTIVLLTNSLRTALLAWASGAEQRVGYVRNGRGPLLTHKLYHPRRGFRRLPTPAIDAYLQTGLRAGLRAGIAAAWNWPRCRPTKRRPTRSGKSAIYRSGDQVVVLNSGGAYGAAKLWPSEYFAELARRIVDRTGTVRAGAVRPRRTDHGPRDRRAGRSSARGRAWPTKPLSIGLEQSLHPPQPAVGDDRQRTAIFRRGVRRAGDLAVRSHADRLDAARTTTARSACTMPCPAVRAASAPVRSGITTACDCSASSGCMRPCLEQLNRQRTIRAA